MSFSKILASVTDFVGGGLFKEIKDTLITYYPPDISPLQKAELDLKIQGFLNEKQIQTNQLLTDAAVQIDKRIAEQEGTAADLKVLGWVGKPIIFLRGVQRPMWGFATLYLDHVWLFGGHTFSDQQNTAMIVINVLVLGFLFGERAVLNMQPLIERVFSK